MSQHDSDYEQKRLDESRSVWDAEAPTFDEEPDHGLRDPVVREAWTGQLKSWLPKSGAPLTVLDIGCGTGSLSVIMAELGHTVTGIDLSPAMIDRARQKAAKHGVSIDFHVMDAAHPQFPPHQFDVILCRHLLWALPEPKQVLTRWMDLLKRPGRLVLVEGYWSTGAGLRAEEILGLLPSALTHSRVERLSENASLWGRTVNDERYAIIADLK